MSIKMLTSSVLALAVAVGSSAVLFANQAQAQPKPDAKPEAKAETGLAGKWNVNIDGPNGPIESALDLKVDGKKLAGMISSQMGDAKLEGEIADAKFTF